MPRLARIISPIIAVLALAAGPASAQAVIGPAAVVNDEVITNYDIDQRARLLLFNGAPQTPDLARIAFDQLVEDRLKIHAGEQEGVGREDVDVEAAIDEFAAQRGLTPDELAEALARQGASLAALEDALAADAVWRQVVRSRFGGRARPSEGEVDQEIALASAGGNVSLRLAEIAIPVAGRGEAEAQALAQRVYDELQGGADFAAAARRYSGAPSAAQGGEIGWIPRGALPPEAQQALAETPVGGITPPLRGPNSVAILHVLERREEPRLTDAAADPEAREQLRLSLTEQRLQRLAAAYLQELRSDAVIEMR